MQNYQTTKTTNSKIRFKKGKNGYEQKKLQRFCLRLQLFLFYGL